MLCNSGLTDCVLAKVGIMCGLGDLLFPRVVVLYFDADSSFVKFCLRPKLNTLSAPRRHIQLPRYHEIGYCLLGGTFTCFAAAGRELWRSLTGMERRGGAIQQLNFYRLRHTFMFDGRLHFSRPTLSSCHMLHTIQPDCVCYSTGIHLL